MSAKGGRLTTDEDRRKRRDAIVSYIWVFRYRYGFSPSYREIAEGLGISSTCIVSRDLDVLAREGRIALKPFKARSVRIVGVDDSLDKAA